MDDRPSPGARDRLGVAFSTSTWRQPVPASTSAAPARVVDRIAATIDATGPGRLRVAIDGLTAAGKTSFGHELAHALVERGRQALRASLDDFKRPWSEAHRYDRTSGEGYYRNAFDLDAIRSSLSGGEHSGMRRWKGARMPPNGCTAIATSPPRCSTSTR